MDQKNLIIIIVIAVVAVVLGGFLGMAMQSRADAPKIANGEKFEATVKVLSSKVVPSIIAYGQVSKIEDKNITLSYDNQTITVPAVSSTQVYTYVPPPDGSKTNGNTQKKVSFSEIKKGDSLNIIVKVHGDGKLEAQSVIILMKAK